MTLVVEQVYLLGAAFPSEDLVSAFGSIIAANAEVDKAIAAGDYSPVTIAKVSDGVYFARAYSHNSLVVEMKDSLVVFDAPVSDWQSNWSAPSTSASR